MSSDLITTTPIYTAVEFYSGPFFDEIVRTLSITINPSFSKAHLKINYFKYWFPKESDFVMLIQGIKNNKKRNSLMATWINCFLSQMWTHPPSQKLPNIVWLKFIYLLTYNKQLSSLQCMKWGYGKVHYRASAAGNSQSEFQYFLFIIQPKTLKLSIPSDYRLKLSDCQPYLTWLKKNF